MSCMLLKLQIKTPIVVLDYTKNISILYFTLII